MVASMPLLIIQTGIAAHIHVLHKMYKTIVNDVDPIGASIMRLPRFRYPVLREC